MPQLTQISLNRESDSTTVVFNPTDVSSGVGRLSTSDGVPVGDARIGISNRYTNDRYRLKLTLAVPVVQTETVNGISRPKVVRTAFADVEFNFSNESNEAERLDVVEYVSGMLADTQSMIRAVLVDLENVY